MKKITAYLVKASPSQQCKQQGEAAHCPRLKMDPHADPKTRLLTAHRLSDAAPDQRCFLVMYDDGGGRSQWPGRGGAGGPASTDP